MPSNIRSHPYAKQQKVAFGMEQKTPKKSEDPSDYVYFSINIREGFNEYYASIPKAPARKVGLKNTHDIKEALRISLTRMHIRDQMDLENEYEHKIAFLEARIIELENGESD